MKTLEKLLEKCILLSRWLLAPIYLALAVGCGSKPVPWLNDSGFWIITRMTGMKETETLKIVTPMMSLMGVVGLPVVMLGAWLFPLK